MQNIEPGQCPFLKQQCIKERCALWGAVTQPHKGPLAGTVRTAELAGCAFNLLVFLIGMPRPVFMPPPSRPHHTTN